MALKSAAIAVAAAVLAIYLLRLNPAAGLMVDDGWYILLGKAIAEGSGYRLISSATVAMLPLYPPGFPAILSLVFRVSPEFPQNVWLLKSVSMAAMAGVGFFTYVYFTVHRQAPRDISACAAVAVAIVPAFVFLATSTLMSECVFTFVQLATVVAAHRSFDARVPARGRMWIIFAAVLTAGAVLIRSAALGVVPAVVAWLLYERRPRRAALFTAITLLCLLPWLVYAHVHQPTAEQRAAHGGAVVYAYGDQFWMKWAGSPGFGRITLRDLPARVWTNVTDIFARDVGGIVVPVLFRGSGESGEEVVGLGGSVGLSPASMGSAPATMVISLMLSTVALVGFVQAVRRRLTVAEFLVPVSIAIVLLWPFWSFRFVLPLTPFLLFYFVSGFRALTGSWRLARLVLLCVIGLNAVDHLSYIIHTRQKSAITRNEWLGGSRDVDEALDWMDKNLGPDGILATTNPALVYLRTGRKSVAFDDPTRELRAWKAQGVRFVACLLPLELPSRSVQYRVLYHSAGRMWVIEL